MKLLITTDDGQELLFQIDGVNHLPFGIYQLGAHQGGGFSLTPALRSQLTKFLYENPMNDAPPIAVDYTEGPLTLCRGNFVRPKVVLFRKR